MKKIILIGYSTNLLIIIVERIFRVSVETVAVDNDIHLRHMAG